jgi:hypothetical protein
MKIPHLPPDVWIVGGILLLLIIAWRILAFNFKTVLRIALIGIIGWFVWRALSGCVAPYRVETSAGPSLDTCRYKTYLLLPPDDQTRTHWLSDPKHRDELEGLLNDRLAAHGLAEAAAGTTPDIFVRQRLESSLNGANQTTEGVTMASDYKLAKWKVELAESANSPAIWSFRMDAVIGDLESQNLSRAHAGLQSAFTDYPSCRSSKK